MYVCKTHSCLAAEITVSRVTTKLSLLVLCTPKGLFCFPEAQQQQVKMCQPAILVDKIQDFHLLTETNIQEEHCVIFRWKYLCCHQKGKLESFYMFCFDLSTLSAPGWAECWNKEPEQPHAYARLLTSAAAQGSSPRSGEFARLHEMQLNSSVGNSIFLPFACYTLSLQWKASPPLPALGKWAILPSAELQMTVWGRGGVHACFKGDWKSLAPPESQVVICHGG